jgi:hypothetical protein
MSNVKAQAPARSGVVETKHEADGGLPDAACSASEILASLAGCLGPLFQRHGVGTVEFRHGKMLRFNFGHCRIGVQISGDSPDLYPFTSDDGILIPELPPVILKDFHILGPND